MKSIVITGGVAFDHIMAMPSRFKDHIMPDKIHMLNVSFNVDKLRKERGGTGGNQAYNLALLGIQPKLIASAGKDFKEYKKDLEVLGVDVSLIVEHKDDFMASGFVVTDQDDNQVWSFYSGAMSRAKEIDIKKHIDSNCLVVVSPNDHQAMKRYVFDCDEMRVECLFDPAFWINNFSKNDLRDCILKSSILIGNDYEIELLQRKTKLTKKDILKGKKILITTLGAKGSLIEKEDKQFKIPAAKPKNTSDPTGAGDAYRAGFVAGYVKGLPLSICGRMGSVAAVYTVEKYGTQTHKFSLKEFKNRYKENFGESLAL